MAFDTNVQTFSDAEILAFIRQAIVCVLTGGQAVSDQAKNLARAPLAELRAMEADYQNRVTSSDTGGLVLVQYGERV